MPDVELATVDDLFDVFEPWTDPDDPGEPEPTDAEETPTAADFLRDEAIPDINGTARQMEALHHLMRVQDLLDLPDPALRVLFWPHTGRMDENPQGVRSTLEFIIRADDPGGIAARFWSGNDVSSNTSLGRVPVDLLDLEWVGARLVDFVERVLAQT